MKADVKDILVQEIMTKSPRTGTSDMTVKQAAQVMRSARVGSLIILEGGKPIGILTERDLMNKIVAEGKSPGRVKVAQAMSQPLIYVTPTDRITDAAEKMSRSRVRRLPVVKGEKLVGIITENDILRLSPALIEITREWSRITGRARSENKEGMSSGYCESCSAYSDQLLMVDGELLCQECREGME